MVLFHRIRMQCILAMQAAVTLLTTLLRPTLLTIDSRRHPGVHHHLILTTCTMLLLPMDILQLCIILITQ